MPEQTALPPADDVQLLQFAVETGQKLALRPTETLYDHEKFKVFLIDQGPGKAPLIHEIDIPEIAHPEYRSHEFASIEGFCKFLSSRHCEDDDGVVFVGSTKAIAYLRYLEKGKHEASVDLAWSASFLALLDLAEPMSQKDFWRLLGTKLHGCVDEALELQIAALGFTQKSEGSCAIEQMGLDRRKGDAAQTVFVHDPKTGDHREEICTAWTFKLPIYACALDDALSIPVRLEALIHDAELYFTVTPIGLPGILDLARSNLVKRIEDGVPLDRFTVLEGVYGE